MNDTPTIPDERQKPKAGTDKGAPATPVESAPGTGHSGPQPRAGGPGGARGGSPHRRRRQKSRYGVQMEEKQNLKSIYGIREQQLRRYYQQAQRSPTETGPQLIELLERRLDNTVYRAGFAPTRPAARQMVTHGLLQVNGRAIDIPSARVRVGDTIQIKKSKRDKALFTNFAKRMQNVAVPAWLELDAAAYACKVTQNPLAGEAGLGVDVRAIVEYFAR